MFEEDISKQKKYLWRRINTYLKNRITIRLAPLEIKICSAQIDSRIVRKRNINRLGKLWNRLFNLIWRSKCCKIDCDQHRINRLTFYGIRWIKVYDKEKWKLKYHQYQSIFLQNKQFKTCDKILHYYGKIRRIIEKSSRWPKNI